MQVYSASSDGTVGVWDSKTCECLKRIKCVPISFINPLSFKQLLASDLDAFHTSHAVIYVKYLSS